MDEKQVMNEPQEFNWWVCEYYWHKAVLIAFRFTDAGCNDPRLWCEWHVRYRFGKDAPPDDEYIENEMKKRRSVRLLIDKPEISAQAEIMASCWEFRKRELIKNRTEPPPIVILPPEPEPAPIPKPVPKKEEPKKSEPVPVKQKPVWLIKAGVYVSIIGPLVLLATKFLPPPWNIVGSLIWEVVKVIIGG